MKILVYDVAAEYGGALTILNNVYEYAKSHKEIEWKFIVSVVDFEQTSNIIVEKYPNVKKSWLARLKFDKFTAPKIINDYNPDLVLNFQNIAVKCKQKQYVYMHQSLPFSEVKFSIKYRGLWVYQNIIGRMIKRSCKRVDRVIVQTNWIKDAIVRDCKIDPSKIDIIRPTIDTSCIKKFVGYTQPNQYFYPANEEIYKNHEIIIEACSILSSNGFNDYNIILSLNGDENDYITSLYNRSIKEKLNIEWRGKMSREEVYDMYSKNKLLFASYIETFGLPLLEAKLTGTMIIAADTPFAHEICDDYDNVSFFKYNDANRLAELISE